MNIHLINDDMLTDWFRGEVKPTRRGVYLRNYGLGVRKFCYWTGKQWKSPWSDPCGAAYLVKSNSTYQNLMWRGLKAPS